ncbi:MAG: hypothetical protein LBI15_01805 [Dysgonamonadaceae bacterium]|jgi:hypothetical protein|nr:hypothetical protein [Dysgonamonadaceae bacterium]
MDTNFNFSRFLKVISNEWCLNWKKVLLFWGVVVALFIGYFAYQGLIQKEIITIYSAFWTAILTMSILQGFYLQIYFREFLSKKKTTSLLLLPASRNETFWAKLLLSFIPYVIIFIMITLIGLEWLKMQNEWVRQANEFDEWRLRDFHRFYQTFDLEGDEFRIFSIMFLVWIFSASIHLFSIVSFKKWAAVKSIVLIFGVIVGASLATFVTYFLFTGSFPVYAFPGERLFTNDGGAYFMLLYPISAYCYGMFFSLFLMFISYVKYNEKTI